jgi:hypothetical protein
MKRKLALTLLLPIIALAVLGVVRVSALTGYNLDWWSVDGGGAISSTGSGYSVDGTIGQPDAGIARGGSYTLVGGFWGGSVDGVMRIFIDVPSSYWAFSSIERLYNGGITGGCTTVPLNYCPTTPVTRAQMAIFLLRGIHGNTYSPPAATGTKFTDVPLGTFGAAWIEQLAVEGITSGCGGGNYCPTQTVSRAQMAVFLVRAKHGSSFVPPTATGIFPDVPVGSFGANYIEQLVADAITSGCGGGNYCPNTMVKRDSMAVFLVKTFNLP